MIRIQNKYFRYRSIQTLLLLFLFAAYYYNVFAEEVIIYTSVDQVFSEPLLKAYENKTGIKVKAIYDVEAAKTTGLVNRLIAEKKRPKCDVFWNSEIARTIILKKKDVLMPYFSESAKEIPKQFKDKDGYWTGFAARARILIYNKKRLSKDQLPHSIFQLSNPKWHSQFALAHPLFGTTATHIAALFAYFGIEKTCDFLLKLKKNNVKLVNGNSVTRDLVVAARIPIAFTDTDDANVAIQKGKSVGIIYPDINGIGTLLIPNTVALIKKAPHTDEGKKLIDFLLSEEVESKLAHCESAQMPLRKNVAIPEGFRSFSDIKAMKVDYDKLAENIERSARFCQKVFYNK
ncbi:iron ABC transporter substrate-binding protein [Candidatus Magnetomorum sp. HK-1]|nr:iron ABC transporter substrate-binding protein [Candidatus Magnetomorum sp. HK-1]